MEIKIDTAMKYINIDDMNAIDIASEVIQDGGLIAYPTDTLYGLGGDARNAQAIKKINLIKNRKTPISVIVWSLDIAASWTLASKKNLMKLQPSSKESSTVIYLLKIILYIDQYWQTMALLDCACHIVISQLHYVQNLDFPLPQHL